MSENVTHPRNLDTQEGRAFPATRWSLVLQARLPDQPKAHRALEELCRQYWFPIYAFLRREGYARHDAQDLTQSFFADVLREDTLQKSAPERGRLRTFLLASLKRHLIDHARQQNAQKRGGRETVISLDDLQAEERLAEEPAHQESPDRLFERAWARDVFDRSRAKLRENYTSRGKTNLFESLEECLGWNDKETSYRSLAARLSLGEPAVRLQVFRLRQKYRELLEAEVADTVASPEELNQELAWLAGALRA